MWFGEAGGHDVHKSYPYFCWLETTFSKYPWLSRKEKKREGKKRKGRKRGKELKHGCKEKII